jgi:hypothetical protein
MKKYRALCPALDGIAVRFDAEPIGWFSGSRFLRNSP